MAARKLAPALGVLLVIVSLYFMSVYSLLLFHTLVEFLRIAVAFSIFILAWNARRFLQNGFLLVIGIGYLSVGSLDLVHALSYDGMGVFLGYDDNLPTQAWILARLVESVSLLLAPFFVSKKPKPDLTLALYGGLTMALLGLLFSGILPPSFRLPAALMPAWRAAILCASLLLSGSLLAIMRVRSAFEPRVVQVLLISIALTMLSTSGVAILPAAGQPVELPSHLLTLASSALLYLAVIRTGLEQPFDLLFRDLKAAQEVERRSRMQAESRAAELESLRGLLSDLQAELDPQTVIQEVLRRAVALLRARGGELGLYDQARQEILIAACMKMPMDSAGSKVRIGQGALGMAAESLMPVRVHEYEARVGEGTKARSSSWKSGLAVPMSVRGTLVGVLGVVGPESGLAPGLEDERLLSMFAQEAAVAIRNAQVLEKAQKQAKTDALTNLSNRRHFFELGEHEVLRTRRYGHPLSLIMLDFDNFKHVNDHYGHAVGDRLLVEAARVLRLQLREADVVARYGGDEFVVLLPECSLEVGLQVAERLRSCVEKIDIKKGHDHAVKISISLGIAEYGQSCDDLGSLLLCADRALYQAKEAGHNRARAWREPSMPSASHSAA